MANQTKARKDAKDARRKLRPLTTGELEVVAGGNGIPGNYSSSSGGGGTSSS